jgi:NAD+ diphosphatase
MGIEKEQLDNPVRISLQLEASGEDRFIVFIKDQVIIGPDHTPFLNHQQLKQFKLPTEPLFLGHTKESPSSDLFCVRLDNATPLGSEFTSTQLRNLILLEHRTLPNLLSRAKQLLDWRENHRFCGKCGGATQQVTREYSFKCDPCSLYFYPRISPCIIVLVVDGDRCLLAKGAYRKVNFYSTLAGFMEVGETPEQAVKREVWEETGIKVKNIEYIGSQSWPFPSQLMIGFIAKYRSGEININPEEIEDAQWFHFDELPPFPPVTSIAGRLIEEGLRRHRSDY